MEITQQVRDMAAAEDAAAKGMDEKSKEFVEKGAEIYSAPAK
jgi:phosphomethylpyrimidine synthase